MESVEEIFCSKIRTVIERKKCRDYFDLWKLLNLSIDFNVVEKIIKKKLKIKGVDFRAINQIFPSKLSEILSLLEERAWQISLSFTKFRNCLKRIKEFFESKRGSHIYLSTFYQFIGCFRR